MLPSDWSKCDICGVNIPIWSWSHHYKLIGIHSVRWPTYCSAEENIQTPDMRQDGRCLSPMGTEGWLTLTRTSGEAIIGHMKWNGKKMWRLWLNPYAANPVCLIYTCLYPSIRRQAKPSLTRQTFSNQLSDGWLIPPYFLNYPFKTTASTSLWFVHCILGGGFSSPSYLATS